MKQCIHLDYEPNYPSCELCTATPHFPEVRYWKRNEVPYEGAPVKVQFCKLRGRINEIFACYNGEMSCYQPAEDGQPDTMEETLHIAQQAQHKITPPHQYCDNRFCVNWDRDVCTLDHCHFTAALDL